MAQLYCVRNSLQWRAFIAYVYARVLLLADSVSLKMPCFNYEDLMALFDSCFASSHSTRLVKGRDEPLYLPRNTAIEGYEARPYHQIIFAHGFFRSALHEIAHWMVAGEARREQVDYGYWYVADGRNAAQQAVFEQVEVHPQAIEWLLTKSTGHRFGVSIDNLDGAQTDPAPFKRAVVAKVHELLQKPLTPRIAIFQQKLSEFYGQADCLAPENFRLEDL